MCTQSLLTVWRHEGIPAASGQGKESAITKKDCISVVYNTTELQKVKGYQLLVELCETHF